jgi:hypothetical protein
MAATFSFVQLTGSSGNSTTPAGSGLTATSSSNSMSWDFETADNTGTTTYTANPVSAGSASYPVWLKFYFTNGVAFTVSNLKFWQFNPAASSANTASFTVFGTNQTAYSIATGTATGTSYASNVQVQQDHRAHRLLDLGHLVRQQVTQDLQVETQQQDHSYACS